MESYKRMLLDIALMSKKNRMRRNQELNRTLLLICGVSRQLNNLKTILTVEKLLMRITFMSGQEGVRLPIATALLKGYLLAICIDHRKKILFISIYWSQRSFCRWEERRLVSGWDCCKNSFRDAIRYTVEVYPFSENFSISYEKNNKGDLISVDDCFRSLERQ